MSDDDATPGEAVLGWLALTLVLCVIALMVTGTVYVIHRIVQAW